MNNDPNRAKQTPLRLALTIAGGLAVVAAFSISVGYSRVQEFNASPPDEETWQATIHANTWDPSLAPDAPCVVRRRSAMRCRYGCYRRSVTHVECGGRALLDPRDASPTLFVSERSEHVDDWSLTGGGRMLWDHAAGTLILESTTDLEPRRLALKVAPTSKITVDPHCRATLKHPFSTDATPQCAYAYLDDTTTP